MWLKLVITDLCNFKCQMCLREFGGKNNVSIDILDKVLPDAKKLGFIGVGIAGGEPCLHPKFKYLIHSVVKNKMRFGVTSNGSVLDKYKFLAEKYRSYFQLARISLDGATQKVHDKLRQEGSFDKAINSIKYYVDNGIETEVVMCINKLNIHQIEDVCELASDLGVDSVGYTSAISTPLNKSIVLNDEEKQKCAIMVYKLKRNKFKLRNHKIKRIHGSPVFITRGGIHFCQGLNILSKLTINPKNEISLCCNTMGYGAIVGSLEKDSFIDLYYKALRVAADLKRIRMTMLLKGKSMDGFDNCEFCNTYLKNRLVTRK